MRRDLPVIAGLCVVGLALWFNIIAARQCPSVYGLEKASSIHAIALNSRRPIPSTASGLPRRDGAEGGDLQEDCFDGPFGVGSDGWLAIFTAFLMASTIGLWFATERAVGKAEAAAKQQSLDMQASVSAAEKAANAAELGARAAISGELPILHIEAVTTESEGLGLQHLIDNLCPKVRVVNYGKSPAFVTQAVVNAYIGILLPEEPSYRINKKYPEPAVIGSGKPWEYVEYLFDPAAYFVPADVARFVANDEEDRVWLHIYGYVEFTDFMGVEHKVGFAHFRLFGSPKFVRDNNAKRYQYHT